MGWSGITSIVSYSAGNAQAVSVQSGEMVKIRTVRPVTGPDGEVVIYDQTGTPIKTISVSKTNPDNTVEFLTSATSLNYSTTVAFDSPGLTIDFAGASPLPSYNPSTGATQFPGPVVAPTLVATASVSAPVVNGAAYDPSTGNTQFQGAVVARNTFSPRPGLISVYGDSIVANNMGRSFVEAVQDVSWRWRIAHNGAVGGETSAQALVRLAARCGNDRERACLICAGTNDVTSVAATVANIYAMAETALSRAVVPVICIPPPKDGDVVRVAMLGYALKVLCRREGYFCLAPWDAFLDASADGTWASGASSDGTHPTPNTAITAGATAEQVLRLSVGSSLVPLANMDAHTGYPYPSRACFLSPSGGLAAGWTKTGGVATTVPGAVGNIQKLTATDAEAAFYIQQQISSSVGLFAPGDKVLMCARMSLSDSSNAYVSMISEVYGPNTAYERKMQRGDFSDFDCVLEFVWPSGAAATSFTSKFKIWPIGAGNFSGELSIQRVNYINLTALGVG